jgi:hypothetical protein
MSKFCSPNKIDVNDNTTLNAERVSGQGTCFDLESLIAIAEAFNKWKGELCSKKSCIYISKIKNIKSLSKNNLYKVLKSKLMNLCAEEYCWADLDFINSIKDRKIKEQIKHFTFKPRGTIDSKRWLNTNDINDVIRQYEVLTNKNEGKYTFKFLGAQPSDIYKVIKVDYSELKNKYSKVAIVFNNDTHNQAGSHWLAVFIDNKQRTIEYFDSLGKMPNKYIKGFLDKFKGYPIIYNKIVHQTKGSQCGLYACYFIIQKLKGKTLNEINARIITDEMMIKYRSDLFRPFE